MFIVNSSGSSVQVSGSAASNKGTGSKITGSFFDALWDQIGAKLEEYAEKGTVTMNGKTYSGNSALFAFSAGSQQLYNIMSSAIAFTSFENEWYSQFSAILKT